MAAGVVKLKPVAQDGMRVRARPVAGSFRRKENWDGYRDATRRLAPLAKAVARLPAREAITQRPGNKAEDARGSRPEAEATVMKRGDGGFRPADNPQRASAADSRVIVGVDGAISDRDQGQRGPMVAPVMEPCGQAPDAWLGAGGSVGHEQLERARQRTVV